MLPGVIEDSPSRVWFGRSGCVEQRLDGQSVVLIGGSAVGMFAEDDLAARNVLIAIIASTGVNRQQLAKAFRISGTTVERVVTQWHRGGLKAVAVVPQVGGRTVQTAALRRRVRALFERGLGPRAAHREVAKRLGYGTVQSMHQQWRAEHAAAVSTVSELVQIALPTAASNDRSEALPASDAAQAPAERPSADEVATDDVTPVEIAAPVVAASASLDEDELACLDDERSAATPAVLDSSVDSADAQSAAGILEPVVDDRGARSELSLEQVTRTTDGQLVQHVGAWLLVGMVHALGVYDLAAKWRGKSVGGVALRVCLDAAVLALALGQKCVEGVRRLHTPTVGTLLRHRGAVSASWVRRALKLFADHAGTMFQATVASTLLKRSAAGDERVWLYVDNHMRPYTGKHTVRKGWRMQDKKAVPGTSDYYVHDEDGFPLWRITTTAHESLCAWLGPVVEFAKLALGGDVTPALVFDRAGAFPAMMATLRTLGAEFVTYERKPYALLTPTAFDQQLTICLASRPAQPILIRYTEAAQKNLGSARGRVRRIALLMDDGAQINLLAVSSLPAETLIRKQLARWGCQENQFKHEVERWGINQLDGRKVEEYPPDAVIPNPARNKIEHELRLAAATEGSLRCDLARVPSEHPRRARLEEDLRRSLERQDELAALRASVPKRAPVKNTPLAGKLRRHVQPYKTVLDTLRIALANAESDLALRLAAHLDRPREAKKALATLFAAPGLVRVTPRSVSVRLAPAATPSERAALAAFLRDVNRLRLSLPGDAASRSLRFGLTPPSS